VHGVGANEQDLGTAAFELARCRLQYLGHAGPVALLLQIGDFLLRGVVPDIAAYEQVYKQLIQQVPLSDVSSSFAMEALKYTTAVPLSYAAG
jgi:Lrp/AsnC family transcriptional regulator